MFTPFPDSQLGTDHVVLTYCRYNANCILAVVGVTDDSTNVTVVFPSNFKGVLELDGKTYVAGEEFHLTLFNLQTFQLLSKANLSGVIVRSNNKVGVFVGADRTSVSNTYGRNHLGESLPPVSYWGKQYILVRRGSDAVQIVSSTDNNHVNITTCDKTLKYVINPIHDIIEFQMECPFCHISSSNRILVAQFIKSTDNNENPSLYFPTPVIFYSKSYAVTPPPKSYTPCQVGLVARMDDLVDIAAQLTGESVSWINVSSTGFAVTTVVLQSEKTLIVRSKNEPFGGHLSCELRKYMIASTRLASNSSIVEVDRLLYISFKV
ncbi:uncharacterized protein LOC117335881 [Pecten maximus]|uniref:uncharacterized protein LOC117335881 n=1 Tax=Pecten maximus TaxID=6579 RepID=UPI001458A444|nr:uncharacterized protein LOC117335881 [Pecten maximus]